MRGGGVGEHGLRASCPRVLPRSSPMMLRVVGGGWRDRCAGSGDLSSRLVRKADGFASRELNPAYQRATATTGKRAFGLSAGAERCFGFRTS